MRKSVRPSRVASRVIEVGVFLPNKTSPAKVTTLSSALARILSCKIIASLLLEQVVDGSDKYNRGLGDYFHLCSTILGSSSGPFQLIARCRDDDPCGFRAEKKRACPVLLELNPPAHRPFSSIDLQLEDAPVWNMCSFQFNGICFKENKLRLIATP